MRVLLEPHELDARFRPNRAHAEPFDGAFMYYGRNLRAGVVPVFRVR